MNETGEELPADGKAEPVLLGCEAEKVSCVQGLRAPSMGRAYDTVGCCDAYNRAAEPNRLNCGAETSETRKHHSQLPGKSNSPGTPTSSSISS